LDTLRGLHPEGDGNPLKGDAVVDQPNQRVRSPFVARVGTNLRPLNNIVFTTEGSEWGGFPIVKIDIPSNQETDHYWSPNNVVLFHLAPSFVRYKVGSKLHEYYQVPGNILISPRNYEYAKGMVVSAVPEDRLIVELDQSTIGYEEPFEFQLGHYDGIQDQHISTLIRLMETEIIEGCPTGKCYAESLSMALVSRLVSHYAQKNKQQEVEKATLSPQKLRRVTEYIYSHLDSNISLRALSALLQTNTFSFCRRFRATTGVTPHQYLTSVRIGEARRFLEEGNLSILEISLLLGFANQSHFTRTFTKTVGISPGRYRVLRTARLEEEANQFS
jgi:AraC-like DNA-binding protein